MVYYCISLSSQASAQSYFKACNAISGITKWAKHSLSCIVKKVVIQIHLLQRLEFLTKDSRSPERYKKNSTAPVTSSFSGKEVKEEKERDVNGNEAASASNLRFYLELKGQRRIPAGTELTIRYNSVFEVTCKAILFLSRFSSTVSFFNFHYFQGFAQRQRTFTHEWFFQCSCPRCSDITEFGTFTSAVKCFQCSKGFVIPYPTLLNSNLKGRIKLEFRNTFKPFFLLVEL